MIKLILSFSIPSLIFFLIIMKLNADNLPPDYKETIPNPDYSKSFSKPEIVLEKHIEIEDSVGGCRTATKTKNGEYLLNCYGNNNRAIVLKYNKDFSPVFLTKITFYDSILNAPGDGIEIGINNISESDSSIIISGYLDSQLHLEFLDKDNGIIKNQYYNFQVNNTLNNVSCLQCSLLSAGIDKYFYLDYKFFDIGTGFDVITYLNSFSMNAISNKIVILDSINDFETKPLIIYDSVNNVYDGVFVYAPTSKGSFLQGLSHIRFDDNLNILTKQMVPFANNYYPVKYTNFDNKPVLWGSYEHQSNTSKHLDILEFTDSSDYSKYLSHRVDFNYQMSFTNVIKSRDGGYLISGAITFFDVDSLYSTHGISDYALIKLDKDFNLVWERFWGTSLDENLVWCEEQDNGNIYVVGNRYNYISSDVPHKIYLAEIKNPSTSVDNDPVNNNEAEIIFPSIVTTTSPELKIIAGQSFDGEVFVTDLLGNCIQSAHISSLSNNTNYIRMDFTSMLPGVYFIGIRTGNGLEVRKFIFAP